MINMFEEFEDKKDTKILEKEIEKGDKFTDFAAFDKKQRKKLNLIWMYKILIGKKASKFLSKLDLKSYRIISNAIKKLSNFHSEKNLDIKSLKGKYENMTRLRIGSRRILFTVDEINKEINIWIIEDRGDIYWKNVERNPD